MESSNMPRIRTEHNGYQTRKRNKDNDLKLATWNVRTMMQPGKLDEIADEVLKYHIDVAALQEIRWKGCGEIRKRKYALYYSGNEQNSGMYGTGFIVNKSIQKGIIGFNPVNERICTLRIKGKFNNICLISAYAPTEEASETIKEVFYDELSLVCERVSKYDTIIIMGDFNAKIGKEELAQRRKEIHKGTWKIPGTNLTNQIDHVLISTRWSSSIIDVRSCDHYLVKTILRQRISNVAKNRGLRRVKWDSDKLKDNEITQQFQNSVKNLMHETDYTFENIDDEWNEIETALIESARNVIGQKQMQRNAEWFDNECRKAIKIKNEARQKTLQRCTRANMENYKEKRRIATKLCRNKKKLYMKEKPKLALCKDKDGNMITEENEIIKRWAEHFKDTLNKTTEESQEDENIIYTAEPLIDTPSMSDVKNAINKLKHNKAPGEDAITAELLCKGGEHLCKKLHNLICNVWLQETIPEKWRISILRPIHKKGDKTECNNYRGIMLLNAAYKVLSNILYAKIRPYYEEIIGEYQCGVRNQRSTVDQIYLLKQNMEKCYEFGQDLHILFIDFQQAFDGVNRNKIVQSLLGLGIPRKLANLTMATMVGSKAKVMIQNSVSDNFEIQLGVRQGDALSAMLFNIVLEKAIGEMDGGGNIFTKSHQIIAYADDIAIISKNYRTLVETFNTEEPPKISPSTNTILRVLHISLTWEY
ncbi:uncharacterized protein LOC129616782 [Condylostylus longicornis]|uniref:uncharacterized protein LOC129616782 n=1 Tax=Condylostylus longicornis TaxID=2530218 RepID=UPI00244E324A|nr:uncharacterized protein LOC129616782 [Condylostylus longicornis]